LRPAPTLTPRRSAMYVGNVLRPRQALLLVEYVLHDRADEFVGLGGHAPDDSAVDRRGGRLLVLVLVRVPHRVGQVGLEGVGEPVLSLRTGARPRDRVRVLLAGAPPTLLTHAVV